MHSSRSSNSNNAEVPSNIKIVISVLAFLGFLAFLVAGLIYMSHKYSPRPSDIIVRLHSLTVKHLFRVQGASPLLAIWDANISIHNHRDGKDPHRDKDMNIIVRDLQSILYYKDHGVSCAMHAKPMLEIKSEKWGMMKLEFKAKNCGIKDNSKVVDKFERKMREERRRGHLRMSMKINMVVSTDFLRSPNSTGRYWRTDIRCSHEFDVVYVDGIRKGRMVGHDLNLWYHKCNFDTKMIHSQHTDG